jgi:hypothetical protein
MGSCLALLSGAEWSVGVTVFDYGDPPDAGGEMRAFHNPFSSQRQSARARRWLASCAAVLLPVALAAGTATAATTPSPSSSDPAVISDWNAIAVSTLAGDTTKQPVEDILYTAFVQAAVYNAVVGVDGRYAPYRFHAHAPRGTSDQAAAVAAAHKILVTYVPSAQATLDADYAASLAQIPDGTAKTQGIAFGTRAADSLIRLRAHDGRNAPILFTQPPAPGVWRPTPPAFLPMSAPWLGFVKPLLVHNATQFGPSHPPPALTSARYTRDFNEVKALGSVNSTARRADQTSTALFFSGSALVQYNAALRDQVTVRQLDIVDAARMFAAIDMSVADAIISVWHAKYVYGFWRPITAINLADTDGNPATVADPTWVPLIPTGTPPYPEYPSGYNVINSAVTHGLETLFQTRHLQLTLISTAVPGVQRHYDSGSALRQDVVNARVWLGIHFRTADTVAREMGRRLAAWALDHYFQPVHGKN